MKNSIERIGAPALVASAFFAWIVGALVLGSIATVVVLSGLTRSLIPVVYRDAAGFAANELVNELDRLKNIGGADVRAALDALESKASVVAPHTAFVVTDAEGRVEVASAACDRSAQLVQGFSASPFLQPTAWERVPALVSPCRSQRTFLAGTPFTGPSGGRMLLLFGAQPLVDSLFTRAGLSLVVQHLLPVLIFLLLFSTVTALVLERLFFRHADALANRIRQFSSEGIIRPIAASPLDELNEVSAAFTQLAGEEAAQQERLSREDDLRRRTLLALMHDLKTPLAALEGAVERLESSPPEDQKQRYKGIVRSALDTQLSYATMLEELASVPPDAVGMERQELDLTALLSELCEEVQPLVEKQGQTLTAEVPPLPIHLAVNRDLLRRALQNVVSNAIRYTPSGGRITASVLEDGESIAVTVTDTGRGIHPDDLPRLTEEFFRAASSEGTKGSGLGLSVVDRIVRVHGGQLTIESTLGEGTSVRITLPKGGAAPEPLMPMAQMCIVGAEAAERRFVAANSVLTAGVVLGLGWAAALGWGSTVAERAAAAGFLVFLLALARRFDVFERGLCGMYGILSWVVLALMLRTEERVVTAGFIAAAMGGVAVLLLIYGVLRRQLLLALPMFVLLFNYLPEKEFVLGMLSGCLAVFAAWVCDISRLKTGLAVVAVRITILCGLMASFGNFLCFYQASLALVTHDLRQRASAVAESELFWRHLADDGSPELEQFLSEQRERNPWFDFFIFDESGKPLASAGVAHPRLNSLQPGIPDGFWSSSSVGSGFARMSSMILKTYGTGDSSRRLGIAFPGEQSGHILSRQMQVALVQFGLFVWMAGSLLLILVYFKVYTEIRRRYETIKSGIARYRAGNYAEPIGLHSRDALGEIAAALDLLAARLPSLGADVRRQNEQLRRFLRRCAADLRELFSRVSAVETQDSLPQTLSRTVGDERQGIENLLEIFRLDIEGKRTESERVFLAELFEEECERARNQAQTSGAQMLVYMRGSLPTPVGSPELCVEALRHLLRLAVTASATSGLPTEVVVTGTSRPAIRASLPGVALTDDDRRFLFDPVYSERDRTVESFPLEGYLTARLIKQCRYAGWNFECEKDAETVWLCLGFEEGAGQ